MVRSHTCGKLQREDLSDNVVHHFNHTLPPDESHLPVSTHHCNMQLLLLPRDGVFFSIPLAMWQT